MQKEQTHKTLVIAGLISSCLLSATMVFANPFAAQSEQDYKNLVAKVTKGRAVYVDHFAGPENLTGIILRGLNADSKEIITWNPPGTDFLMIGRLVDTYGSDLTQVAHNFFISETDPGEPLSFESIESELKFFQFSSPASRSEKTKTIHIITDPSCPYCANLRQDMGHFKEDLADLDIRIVPVSHPGDGVKAAANILRHGPVLAKSQSFPNPSPDDLAAVEHNTNLLVGVFPKLGTQMTPYGVPKEKKASESNRTNILCYAQKPGSGQAGKYGKTRDPFGNTTVKKKIRRLWKKRERTSVKTRLARQA